MNIIYALYCPIRKIPTYVGKSTVWLDRPMLHIKNASHSMAINNWVKELKLKGLIPIIVILEHDVKKEFINEREKFWIKKFVDEKFDLLNVQNKKQIESFHINNTKHKIKRKSNSKIKIGVSIKLEQPTIDVIYALLQEPENLKLKGNFNAMVEHLVETHTDYIKMKKELEKKKLKLKK